MRLYFRQKVLRLALLNANEPFRNSKSTSPSHRRCFYGCIIFGTNHETLREILESEGQNKQFCPSHPSCGAEWLRCIIHENNDQTTDCITTPLTVPLSNTVFSKLHRFYITPHSTIHDQPVDRG